MPIITSDAFYVLCRHRGSSYYCAKVAHSPPFYVVIQDCGPPPTTGDGTVEFNSTMNGSVAIYSCDEGYTLNGQEIITCLNNLDTIPGVWSDEPPMCNSE